MTEQDQRLSAGVAADAGLEICPDCNGAGGDNNTFTCPRCNGSGGIDNAGDMRGAWQPIDTAPKDGTTIDVYINGEFPGRRADVQWREPDDSEWWVHGGDTIETPDATWHDCFGPLSKCEQPTHWMPLPAAPTTSQDHP